MHDTRILIGPFSRRSFADGLFTLLTKEAGYSTVELAAEADILRHLDAEEPTVLILETSDTPNQAPVIPKSPQVAVILVSREGSAQISLNQLGVHRLRAAIGLAEQTGHPSVVSLPPGRAAIDPFVLPAIRASSRHHLAPVVDWLDLALAHALDVTCEARGSTDFAAWTADARQARRTLAGQAAATEEEVAEASGLIVAAEFWQQRLIMKCELDPVEVRLICLAAAPELDRRFGDAIAILQNNYAEQRPNLSTLARFAGPGLIGADIDASLRRRRPFGRFRLVRPAAPGREGDPQPGYRVAPALMEVILGEVRHRGPDWIRQGAALPALAELRDRIAAALDQDAAMMFVTSPIQRDAADEVAAALIAAGNPVLRVTPAALSHLSSETLPDAALDYALRARLQGAALIFESVHTLDPGVRAALLGTDFEGLVRAVVFDGAAGAHLDAVPAVVLSVPRPTAADRISRWQAACRREGLDDGEPALERLAAKLRFSLADIEGVTRLAAGRRQSGDKGATEELLHECARAVSVRHAPRAVRRPPCLFDWSDIVLPEAVAVQIRSIPNHVLDGPKILDDWGYGARLPYGRGVGVLFSGPSGTGKTMSAHVIARSLSVELMQVDISRCVSKYIGETEKNIDECFAAAEAASAVLLFDEADALFGKRTEIKDAHDRHANIEVAYLLQRIEAFEGLVILTTNLKANIDTAFLRRLRFVIDFPMPDEAERCAIWERAIPPEAPRAPDLDVSFLARRLELSGGSIQQIAVNAAFAAAAERSVISMRHVMAATRRELLKLGMFTAELALPCPSKAGRTAEHAS